MRSPDGARVEEWPIKTPKAEKVKGHCRRRLVILANAKRLEDFYE
jgi:hypothetical protein